MTTQDARIAGIVAPVASTSTVPLYIFVFSLLLPFQFSIAGAQLFPVRVVVIILFLPLLGKLLSGAAGKVRTPDILILCYAFWAFLSLVINEGLARIPLGAITFVDLFGGWLVGRVLIRSVEDFRCFVRAMIWACVVMLPFAILEAFTNINGLQMIFSPIFDTYSKGWSSYGRLGLERVMTGFAHPILFGVFCSFAVATSYYTFIHLKTKIKLMVGLLTFMTFLSLSSGPLLSAAVQIGLMIWGKVTRNSWKILAYMTVTAYVVVDLLSNRTPITIAINYVTFNPTTAWYRVAQWRFGILEVWDNPIFGIGLRSWERPHWLGESIDNFWLLTTMRYGIPAFLLLAGALALIVIGLVRLKSLSEEQRNILTGYLITFAGTVVVLTTVHVWGAAALFVMMFFGSTMWLFDAQERNPAPDVPQKEAADTVTGPPQRVRPGVAADVKAACGTRQMPEQGTSQARRRALPMNGRIDRRKPDS